MQQYRAIWELKQKIEARWLEEHTVDEVTKIA
jgi:hypothetical protein